MPAPVVVRSAAQAIEILGGANVVAKLLGFGPNAVRNWYLRGLPPESHDVLAPRLRKAGCVFSPKLFKQYVPAKRRKDGSKK